MIYKNEDGTIYKIEPDKGFIPTLSDDNANDATWSNRKSVEEIIEVLNYLLKEVKELKQRDYKPVEPIKPVKPSKIPGTPIRRG